MIIDIYNGTKSTKNINTSLLISTLDFLVVNVPRRIWNMDRRPSIFWKQIHSHYVCHLLGLPDPCNVESDDVRILPKEIADAVEEHFDDKPQPPL